MISLNDAVEPGKDMAATIFKDLFKRLSSRGLFAVEIMMLIEHTIDLIGNGGNFTVASVNHDLESLGWRGGVVDTTAFELIISFLKTGNNYETEKHVFH